MGNLQKLGLQFILLLCVINVVFGSPFKIFKRHYVPSRGQGMNPLTKIRNGRNSKVMLFNHEKGPKTWAPISLKDETTTEIIEKNDESKEETFTNNPVESTTHDDTFHALLGLNDDAIEKEEIDEKKDSSAIMETTKNVGELLADLEKAIAQVDADYEEDLKQIEKLPLKSLESEDISDIENDLADELIAESLQKDRLPKDHESKFDIEHNFSLDDDIQEDARSANPEKNTLRKGDVELAESPILQIKQQPNVPQEQFNSGNPVVSGQNQFPAQVQQQGFNPYRNQQFGNSQQQYNQNVNPALYNNQNAFSQGFNGQNQFQQFGNQQQFYSQATPRQIEDNQAGASSLLNDFGDAMGPDASVDPERNQFSSQPQLNPRQQAGDDNDTPLEEDKPVDEEVRCINKVMQVEETVYDKVIKCQHTFTEKCHDTFITDYVPTQERKCETSFSKNCHITYKPMMFEETVELCNEPLQKVCNNDTVGQGEEICKTHYETNCETRFKEHEVEQDEPVCKMVTERKCNDVRVPVPEATGFLRRKRRQAV